jgi:hypothetical protein
VIYDSESKDSFSIRLPIHRLHHFQKFLFGKYPFLDKQSGKGFLGYDLGYEEFFKGDDLFRSRADAM